MSTTPTNSTVNTRAALGGMALLNPRVPVNPIRVRIEKSRINVNIPYAKCDGMVSVRFSWRHISRSPWSQPLMTSPAPTVKNKS